MPTRYLPVLQQLAGIDSRFICVGSFGLWLWGVLPADDVPDADLIVQRSPDVVARFAQHLQRAGWQLELWGQPVSELPAWPDLLGYHYVRARLEALCIDVCLCDVSIRLDVLLAGATWRHSLPVAALADIASTKRARGLPRDWAQLAAAGL